MKPIIIYSPFSCILKTNDQEIEIDQNEHAIINNDEQKIYVYPIGKTKRYSFIIDMSNKKSEFYTLIEKDNKILIFLLDGLLSENIDIFHLQHNNYETTVEISKFLVSFKTKNHKKQIILNAKPLQTKCGSFYNIDYALLNFDKKDSIIAFNSKTNHLRQFTGDKIELTENGFIVTTNNEATYKKIKAEYYVDSQGLKSKEKIFTITDQIYPEELVPYQFMSAIKNEDYHQVDILLSETLKSKITLDDVKSYFGKISYFYMIDWNVCFALSNNDNIIYEFYIKDNKITEIIDNKTEE